MSYSFRGERNRNGGCPGLIICALRIYLTYKLQDSLQAHRILKLESAVHTRNNQLSAVWEQVLTAAELVIQYIKNCQADDEHSTILRTASFGLVAIDRAEVALAFQLKAVRFSMNKQKCGEYEHSAFYCGKSAKFIINALLADRSHTALLARLWVDAANRCRINKESISDKKIFFIGSESLFGQLEQYEISHSNSTDAELATLWKELIYCTLSLASTAGLHQAYHRRIKVYLARVRPCGSKCVCGQRLVEHSVKDCKRIRIVPGCLCKQRFLQSFDCTIRKRA